MKRIGRWIALSVAGLATAVILMTIIGYFRSPYITARASVQIQRPPQEVWEFLSNLENMPKWSSEVTAVRKISDNPRRYAVRGASGEMETEIVAFEPPRRYVSRMASEAMGFSGDWEITMEPEGAGTRVTSNAKLRIDNPFYRGLTMFMSGDKAEAATLTQLKQHMEAQVK